MIVVSSWSNKSLRCKAYFSGSSGEPSASVKWQRSWGPRTVLASQQEFRGFGQSIKRPQTQWRPTRNKFNITSNNFNKILQFRHTELNNSTSYHYSVNIRRIKYIYILIYIKYTSYIIYRRLDKNKHNICGSWYLKTASFTNTSFLFPLYIWVALTIGLIMECYCSWNL